MPKIERVATTERFNALSNASRGLNENNDCAVKAVALLCAVPYEAAHAKLKELGRKQGSGTPYAAIRTAIEFFDYRIVQWTGSDIQDVITTYPGEGHRNLKHITTHHPRRFKKAWAPLKDRRLLLCVKKHVAAFVDGEVHDWSVNTSKQIWQILEVVKN